ncbi:MAG: nucleotidyltransferase domain-containing protein [Candidatus Helarchaeales archaeon]
MKEILEVTKKRNEILKNYKIWFERIRKYVEKISPDYEVLLFGSATKDRLVASSDIDVLIKVDHELTMRDRASLIAEIEMGVGLPFVHPFEFLVLSPSEFQRWNKIYKIF